MSTINAATNNQQSQASTTTSNTASQTGAEKMGDEFNNFLKLLTAQVRNQDPLSPLDSTQFVEQLATFSSLEQQVRGNSSLESIAGMIGDLHAMFASDWIGKTVTVESSWVPYSGDAVSFKVNAPETVDKAILNITNSAGETLWTEALDLDEEQYAWDGRTVSGVDASTDEVYQFGIDLFSGTNFVGTVAPQVITQVTDVGTESGTLKIGTSSKLSANVDQVHKVAE